MSASAAHRANTVVEALAEEKELPALQLCRSRSNPDTIRCPSPIWLANTEAMF